jgi:nicotinate-nucleotide--dimethylbenzimidazole phosphoribosyltransferase
LARKILLADDSITAQNMGRKILADAGYDVITVNNGSAALKKISEHKPDLLILDVYMPGYGGLEVCQRVKDAGETAKIPILLAVGKLEPFKAEEAKRVRADGFIVKPFEASELLSALSKLEDKIVPSAEPAKPGRLARVASTVEKPTQKTAPTEIGWKWTRRPAAQPEEAKPEKQASKAKTEETGVNDPALYNPVNRDLRTTIDHKTINSKPAGNAPAPQACEQRVDLAAPAPAGIPADVSPEEIAALAAAADQLNGKIAEATPEQADSPKVAAVPIRPEPSQPVMNEERPSAALPEETSAVAISEPEISAQASAPEEAAPRAVEPPVAETDEPATMAAAVADSHTGSSRWTAVAVALAPEEIGLSLEQEMRQAQAATGEATPSPSSQPAASEPVTMAAATMAEPPVAATVSTAEQTFSELAQVATETVSVAVEKLESATVSHAEPPLPVEASQPETPPPPTPQASETEQIPAPQAESMTEAAPPASETQPKAWPEPVAETPQTEPIAEAPQAEPVAEASQPEPVAEASPVEPAPEPSAETVAACSPESEESTAASEAPAEIPEPVAASPASQERVEAAKSGAEIAATTAAAAWASWRRIREARADPAPPQPLSTAQPAEAPPDQEASAMAAAAGAEEAPEQAAGSHPAPEEIASIVDGILAEMRPKILEEVTRKLRNKQP